MGTWSAPPETPLKGMRRCHRTDCTNGLHCFLKHRKRRSPEGTCIACGVDLVDWPRVHQRDLDDVAHTIEMLKMESVRHEFWCAVPLTERATIYARRHGRMGLLVAARKRIASSVGKAAGAWDGRQTPWEDKANVLQYAQHATATCCRKCLEVWHGIPRGEALSARDAEYFAQLLLRFVEFRIPDLGNERQRIPRKAGQRSLKKAS